MATKFLNHIKKFFNIKNVFVASKKNSQVTKYNILNQNSLEYRFENPALSLLHESFQKYGYIRVASDSKHMSPDLYEIIIFLKTKPVNFHNSPSIFKNCRSYEDAIRILTDIYANNIGIEFIHLNSLEEIKWLSDKFSDRDNIYKIDSSRKLQYLKLINRAEQFDIFLGKKFQSVKRYSGEGVESMVVCLLEIFKSCSNHKISDIIISMAHRGRNNVLTTLLNYPPVLYFRKMLGFSEFPKQNTFATGDTFSHFFCSTDFFDEKGNPVHISLIPNPSHLEANIPIGAGKVRSKMQTCMEGDYDIGKTSKNGDNVLGIFIHGDASVYGQGVVSETLVMTDSLNFSIGGGIHIVINNHLGFTTETPNGIKNVTDIGKIVNCPVIHVNAYSVNDVAKAAMLAVDYRNEFRKDIFINLIGYRRWGHNELDDPTMTQPVMYSKIKASKSISKTYVDLLLKENCIKSKNELDVDLENWIEQLNEDLKRAHTYEPEPLTFKSQWTNQIFLDSNTKSLGVYNTGFDINQLKEVGKCSIYVPPNFHIHQNILRTHIERRMTKLDSNESGTIDWATAEALAIGSLLAEGVNCRISGQDVGRGTFSQRHFTIIDQETNEKCVPFNICSWPDCFSKRGYLEVANSVLSEEAVLGFEIGMALDNPNNLFIWEAQFGDFFNGAQILIDTYLGSAETKWMLQNGLVLLLPHGYDGAGPEHSSCRLERFLQLTDSLESGCDSDSVNMNIINPTTPAQYFHALRRQIIRPFRKPLIIASPKLLLRSMSAISNLSDFDNGTFFKHVIPDYNINSLDSITNVLICSGKHYYTLKNHLELSLPSDIKNTFAIIRIEQLTPFPVTELSQEINRFTNAKRFVWCQEEHRNMGAWQFINVRVRNLLGINLEYVGRRELATPAVGILDLHKKEIEEILQSTFQF